MEKTIILSEDAPIQSENHPLGSAWRTGDLCTIFERDGQYGYVLHGIGDNGNSYEMDDVIGFESPEAAEAAARQWYADAAA